MMRLGPWLGGFLAIAAVVGCGAKGSTPEPIGARFVHVADDRLLDGTGAPLTLEGVGYAEDDAEHAYPEIAALGMNHVRFYFSASDLEDDSASRRYRPGALAWLDEQIAQAREHGLYLVLALNVPPGGTGFDCGNDAFWDSVEYQDRLLELWRMLAMRYADEPVIAGYSVLDPPNSNHSVEQWRELAERAAHTIREVDPSHTLFIGRALSIACKFDLPAIESFVRIDDPNVVYEFDRSQPWSYVAQLLRPAGDPETQLDGRSSRVSFRPC